MFVKDITMIQFVPLLFDIQQKIFYVRRLSITAIQKSSLSITAIQKSSMLNFIQNILFDVFFLTVNHKVIYVQSVGS